MHYTESRNSLVSEIENNLKKVAREWTKFLRPEGAIDPEFPGTEIKLSKIRTWKEYYFCLLTHHYIEDEEIRWRVKAELLTRANRYGNMNKEIALIYLNNKSLMLIALVDGTNFHTPSEFFGSYIEWSRTIKNYRLYRSVPRRPKSVQRKRGYNDHGSLKPHHRWEPKSDWSLSQEQERIEVQRKTDQDTAHFLEGWFS